MSKKCPCWNADIHLFLGPSNIKPLVHHIKICLARFVQISFIIANIFHKYYMFTEFWTKKRIKYPFFLFDNGLNSQFNPYYIWNTSKFSCQNRFTSNPGASGWFFGLPPYKFQKMNFVNGWRSLWNTEFLRHGISSSIIVIYDYGLLTIETRPTR